jgi:hypothetical protein
MFKEVFKMRKFAIFMSDVRLNAMLCCSAAILLSACGGGSNPVASANAPTQNADVALATSATGTAPTTLLATSTAVTATTMPIATFSTSLVDFGSVTVGKPSAIKVVTITNTGTANLSFPADFQVADSRYKFGGTGDCEVNVNYAPGESCTSSVVFTPTSTGAQAGSLTITSNASTTPQVLPLTGSGTTSTNPTQTPRPIATFSTALVDFGTAAVGKATAAKVVTITNTGTGALSFPVDFKLGNSQYSFGGTGTCATATNYAPGASCTASVVFNPLATGAQAGSLTVTSNASTSPQVLPLTGNGVIATSPTPAPAPAPTPTPTPAPTSALNLYVATTGSDSNPGTKAAPFKTISKASTVAKAGYIVHVADGTYKETVNTSSSGTANARIIYLSDNKWGAKVASAGGGTTAAWHNKGDYVSIIGFDISGTGAVGINHSGNYGIANQNHVHNISAGTCDGYGGGAIIFDQYNVKKGGTADSNLVHDIGPLGTNCFRVQGIYTSIPDVTISNNIIYKVVGYGVVNGHCSYNLKVLNNTLFNNGGTAEGGAIVMTNNVNCNLPNNNNVVANNIIYDNVIGVHEERVTNVDVTLYTNNLVFGNKTNWGVMKNAHKNDISANPAFVNYTKAGGGDYRLSSVSPAIGKGSTTYFAPTDYLGKTRVAGAAVDLGAYKY